MTYTAALAFLLARAGQYLVRLAILDDGAARRLPNRCLRYRVVVVIESTILVLVSVEYGVLRLFSGFGGFSARPAPRSSSSSSRGCRRRAEIALV